MIDSDSRHGRELKAAEEFFALARITPSPFMRSYYQRVAERYLSSQGELRAVGPSGDHRALSRPITWWGRKAALCRPGDSRSGFLKAPNDGW
jgi:hypothetical protein